MKACFAKNDPDWDCHKWAKETNMKKLKKQAGGVYKTQQEIDAANMLARRIASKWNTLNPEDVYAAKNIGDPVVPFVGQATSNPYTKPLMRLPANFDMSQLQSHENMYWYENNDGNIIDVDPSSIPGTKPIPNLLAKRRRGGYHKMQMAGQFIPNDDSKYNWIQDNSQMIPTRPMSNDPLANMLAVEQPGDTITPAIPITRQKPPRRPWDPSLMLRGASTAASFIGNILENKRQDQYLYNQLSTLGQLDAIPVENFQPKPYSLYAKKGGWIQKAVNPEHEGYCTPMTKPTCTPRRKALAKRFKAMGRARKYG